MPGGELMAKDALGAHARDELGISPTTMALPVQAVMTSAASFTGRAAMPVLPVIVVPAAASSLRKAPLASPHQIDRSL